MKKYEVESKRLEIDLNLKCEEVTRLKRSIAEIDDLREKYITCEQKLDYQVKTNQGMQEKLYQLQSELASRGFISLGQQHSPSSSTSEASYENIIENFKFIISQLSVRSSSSQTEIDELKLKVNIFHFN